MARQLGDAVLERLTLIRVIIILVHLKISVIYRHSYYYQLGIVIDNHILIMSPMTLNLKKSFISMYNKA